jgi:hypothetical protein
MRALSYVTIAVALVAVGLPSVTGVAVVRPISDLKDPNLPPWEYRLEDVSVELEQHELSVEHRVRLIVVNGDGTGRCQRLDLDPDDENARRFQVTESEVLDLLSRLYNSYYFHMPALYANTTEAHLGDDGFVRPRGSGIAHGKWRVLRVTIGDYTKHVVAKDGYPDELLEVMEFIQEFALRCLDN